MPKSVKTKLTDKYLNRLQLLEHGQRKTISDSVVPGLRLRLSHNSKTFFFECTVIGAGRKAFTLGKFPYQIGLADARDRARDIATHANKGVDLFTKEEEERNTGRTVGEVLDVYQAIKLTTLKTGDERYLHLKRELAHYLTTPMGSLKRADMLELINLKHAQISTQSANAVRTNLKAFFNWAVQHGHIDVDPCLNLPKFRRTAPRERTPSIKEVQAIYKATEYITPLWRACLRLIVLTAQRRTEIASIRWEYINWDAKQLELPSTSTKNAKPHIVHLSAASLALLVEWQNHCAIKLGSTPTTGFVFTFTGTKPINGFSRVKRTMNSLLPDIRDWNLHDMRRSFATHSAANGTDAIVVDKVLNHSASATNPSLVANVYNRYESLPERAVALEAWGAMVIAD